MLLFSMLGWWYTRGWAWVARHMLLTRNKRILQFFSVSALAKTMFAPFRQDSTDTRGAPIGEKLQDMGGNLISRFFGFMVRSVLILCGLLLVIFNTLAGVVCIVVWPLLPFAPLVSAILVLLGVGFIHV